MDVKAALRHYRPTEAEVKKTAEDIRKSYEQRPGVRWIDGRPMYSAAWLGGERNEHEL